MLKHCLMYYTLCIYLCIVLCDFIVTMPGDQPPSIPIKTPSFNWDSVNLQEQWKSFSEQCKFLLKNNGPFSKHSDLAHIATVLNWLGLKSYQVFNNLNFDVEGKDKTKIRDVFFMFEKHFKPTWSMLQSWYQLSSIYSSQCKAQREFMSKCVILWMVVILRTRMKLSNLCSWSTTLMRGLRTNWLKRWRWQML